MRRARVGRIEQQATAVEAAAAAAAQREAAAAAAAASVAEAAQREWQEVTAERTRLEAAWSGLFEGIEEARRFACPGGEWPALTAGGGRALRRCGR